MMSPELGLIHDKDIGRKYHSELFANEIILLAYYIAAVNCESMYGQRAGRFEQFNGISLTDTFNTGSIDEHTEDMMASPKRRIKRQRSANITVVIGKPAILWWTKNLETRTTRTSVIQNWKRE